MKYEIVAFMQNPWFKPGTKQRIIDLYNNDQEFHQRVLAGCMSGKRLMQAFGVLYTLIWWDNANPEPVNESQGARPPNIYHMIGVITKISPRIVLTIGEQAYAGMQAIEKMEHEIRLPQYTRIHCHHPNARGKTQHDLDLFAIKVNGAYANYHPRA